MSATHSCDVYGTDGSRIRANSGVILSILYGDDLSTEVNEYFVSLANQAISAYNDGPHPESNLVNAIPLLRYLPPWFPGAEFHRLALAVKNTTTELLEIPMDFVGKGLVSDSSPPYTYCRQICIIIAPRYCIPFATRGPLRELLYAARF